MARFCPECGVPLEENVKFCPSCGKQLSMSEQLSDTLYATASGFSDRVNHPEIIAAMKKNRKASWIFMLCCVPLPIIGFLVYGALNEDMEIITALVIGSVISAVFLVFGIAGLIRERTEKTYDAVVISKKTEQTYRHQNSSDTQSMTVYTTVVRTDDGKKKKIIEREGSRILAYNYLNIGDRFRYHPRFNYPYELFDKSKAPYICCVSCGTKNPVGADRCSKCGIPLLK